MCEVSCVRPDPELSRVLWPKQMKHITETAADQREHMSLRRVRLGHTVSTCLSTVPSAKNSGFLVSTTTRSKKERQDSLGFPDWNEEKC